MIREYIFGTEYITVCDYYTDGPKKNKLLIEKKNSYSCHKLYRNFGLYKTLLNISLIAETLLSSVTSEF